ncbi:formyltransferase family protein [Clostridium cibarium]|uniref:Methionyl-tRNA formyltransferase n=1 Tax=Clostridium cibarium TaxID=2762247 RepID=A0ABR8PYR0_9CLOT|nr:formyltransferase family protein [Clostridium cibarium]MBD7913303.1 methionyl-tRNA formyltransferase [Clostridium cibarium]
MKKTVFIGSVISSKVALETLIKNGVSIDLVCSLDEEVSKNVSDYFPIHDIAEENDIPFIKFKKINNESIVKKIEGIEPDYIFIIGLSQIISQKILDMAKEYSIGFHPTQLPKYRGRAAIPWQIILGVEDSKVTLFKIDQGVDSGDIICQYPYQIDKTDYALDVYYKVCDALKNALNSCINEIYNNSVNFIKQDHENSTYLLARRPEDGIIDWSLCGKDIETLIRATSRPYPGAFSYYKGCKVVFWKADREENTKYIGIPGQIAWINDQGEIAIITKDSLLIVKEYVIQGNDISFLVGHKFI